MGRRTRTRSNDPAELVSLLERDTSGTGEIDRFHARLSCQFDLDWVGHFCGESNNGP